MGSMTPAQLIQHIARNTKREYKTAFWAAFIIGLLTHMPALLLDVPNHDGLGSMYFDQNMITSGRWFLTVACGLSSYFTIPWVIGLLGLLYLALAAVALTALLELKDGVSIVLVSGLLVSFPALASTFAYVFTLDGYMLALLLAVLSVLCTKRRKNGFWAGAVCLAFSMGIYQAYLPFAVLLCIYEVLLLFMEGGSVRDKLPAALRYLYMGVAGVGLYYVLLRLLLLLQGKELASYQGIDGMAGGFRLSSIAQMYRDFLSFSLKGNVIFNNLYSALACGVLAALAIYAALRLCLQRKWWKNPFFFVIIALSGAALPLATNLILLISPEATYHLLMRYQWVLYLILMTAFVSRYGGAGDGCGRIEDGSRADGCGKAEGGSGTGVACNIVSWGLALSVSVLVFNYAVTDNIGYSNLQRRYEKTYAYCERLLDRIEQTEGYYQGIPIAMVGVVGYEPYPVTDITLPVTSNMIGLNGDTLLYTGENYEIFMRNYLGATLNIMSPEEMGDIYFSQEYIEMESFPAKSSVKVVDGIMYVKTENMGRD